MGKFHAFVGFLLLGTSVSGQIANGSFELNGQGTLQNWENSCEQAVLVAGGAPGSGNWYAGYPTQQSNNALCNGSLDFFYQELPALSPYYDSLTIGLWSRMSTVFNSNYFIGIEVAQGVLFNGLFLMQPGASVFLMPTGNWEYNVVTIHNPSPANPWNPSAPRAIGFIAYDTTGTDLLELDGIEILSIGGPLAVVDVDPSRLLGYFDPANNSVVITHGLDEPVLCFDAAGRCVPIPGTPSRNVPVTLSTVSLAPGMYTVVSGRRFLRFVKH